MKKRVLTDRFIASLRPRKDAVPYTAGDVVVPNFGVRVSAKGRLSYVLGFRPAGKQWVRREIAEVGAITLPEARARAREWLLLIKAGRDPKHEPKPVEVNAFAAIAEEFIKRRLSSQRKGWRVAREIRNELMPVWGGRAIDTISRRDVVELIERIGDRPAPAYARNVYSDINALFDWAINRGLYGLEHSPCDRVKISAILGPRKFRTRTLGDDEIRRVWMAAEEMGFPFGMAAQLLLLTGSRSGEIAQATAAEIDPRRRVLIVPAERYKTGQEHTILFSNDAWAIVEGVLSKGTRPYLFSLSNGAYPIRDWTSPKRRLDTLSGVRDWVIHDLRRVARTGLAAAGVRSEVAELCLGHSKSGVRAIYDRHEYEDEIRSALEAWARRLRGILNPDSESNVLRFGKQ